MPVMPVLADAILPIFAILAFGFVLGRAGVVTLEEGRIVNRFAMTVLIPIVVFDLLANAPIDRFVLLPVALYAATQAVVGGVGYLVARRAFALDPGEAVILAYAGIFANNVFYGLPIAVLIHGEAQVLPITMIVVLDSTVAFGGTMLVLQLIERGRVSPGAVAAVFLRTPALAAIGLGLAFGLAGHTIPGPVQTFLDFNGAAGAPVALFALGVVLSSVSLRPDGAVATVVVAKLLIFPAAIWWMLSVANGGWEDNRLFAFAAAGPTGSMAFSLAILHGLPTDRVAQAMLWTAVLTLFTLGVLA